MRVVKTIIRGILSAPMENCLSKPLQSCRLVHRCARILSCSHHSNRCESGTRQCTSKLRRDCRIQGLRTSILDQSRDVVLGLEDQARPCHPSKLVASLLRKRCHDLKESPYLSHQNPSAPNCCERRCRTYSSICHRPLRSS